MLRTPIGPAELQRSVVAVPPLARNADLTINRNANIALIRHLESGGVRSLMYGGNANFFHVPVSEYAALVDFLAEAAGPDTWVLPSVGPDYGKLIDQAAILRTRNFPTAMLLPMSFPFTDAGLADGIRRFTDTFGKPAVVYVKADPYLKPETLGRLHDEGRIAAIKYAVVRERPEQDAYLSGILQAVPKERVVSGIGERPAVIHAREFGLRAFTSGSVCVGPRGSMAMLRHIARGEFAQADAIRADYIPLEDLRDALSPIRVLHEAVTLSGVADMGPMLPMLSNLDAVHHAKLAPVARALLERDRKREGVAPAIA